MKNVKPTRPLSRGRRIVKKIEWAVALLALLYVLLLFFPQPLFAYCVAYGQFTVYSTEEIPEEIERLLDSVEARLQKSDLYDPEARYRVFLCNGAGLYRFLSPFSPRAFGNTYWFSDNVLIADADIAGDRAASAAVEHNERTLTGTITHEIVHVLIRKQLGCWRSMRLPAWKTEGYCEVVAGESSFDYSRGVEILKQEREVESSSFRYFKYRMMVDYLVAERQMSFVQIADAALDCDQVEREMIASLQER